GTPAGSHYLMTNGNVYEQFNLCPQSINGFVLFDAINDTNNLKHALWKTDGTVVGTQMVSNIFPEFGRGWVSLNNVIYFVGYDAATYKHQLWRTDGTGAGTYLVKDINASGNEGVNFLVLFDNMIYFQANDGINGKELWKSDGTTAGTVMAADINPGGSSSPNEITSANGKLFFSAGLNAYGNDPWISDGTFAGTFILNALTPH